MVSVNDGKNQFIKSIIIIVLFYIYANIFLFNPFVTLFVASILVLYAISVLIWDKTIKIRSLFKIAFFLLILIIIFFDLTHWNMYKINTRINQENLNKKTIEINKTNDLNIIFVETNSNRSYVDFKENCAIESAAFNNPNATIMVFSLQSLVDKSLLKEYKNIKLYLNTTEELFNQTPLYDWYKVQKSKILNSRFSIEHLSDALRLALLYNYGGIYTDLDTITIKNFNSLKNFTGVGYIRETINEKFQSSIGNGFLIFPEQRHKMLYEAIEMFTKTYNPNAWASNGPLLLKKIIKSYCGVDDIYTTLMIGSSNKTSQCDVSILPEHYFYPYSWENVKELFKSDNSIQIKTITDSFSVHFYGKMSKNFNIKESKNSIYDFLAKQNCPISYKLSITI